MRFYEKNELAPFVVLNTEVVGAEWHDLEGLWHVTLRDRKSDKTFVDKCNVIIVSKAMGKRICHVVFHPA